MTTEWKSSKRKLSNEEGDQTKMSEPEKLTIGQILTEKFQNLQGSMAGRATASASVDNAAEQVTAAESALANSKLTKASADSVLESSNSDLQSSITELVDQLTQYRDSLGS